LPIDLASAQPVLGSADTAYVAVRTRSGPHLTPELFTVSGGRILCLTAAVTLKAKKAKSDPIVGFCVRSGADSVSGVGEVEVVDPADLAGLLTSPGKVLGSAAGVARFFRDNAAEMVGATADLVRGRLGDPIPPRRVVLSIRPTSLLVTLAGRTELVAVPDQAVQPGAADEAEDLDDREAALDLADVPGELGALAVAGPAVLGWTRHDGVPLALPISWDPAESAARLPTGLFEGSGASSKGPGCVTFDTWTGLGPSGKQGLMLRGTGEATEEGASTTVVLDVDRAAHWDGVETGTVPVGD